MKTRAHNDRVLTSQFSLSLNYEADEATRIEVDTEHTRNFVSDRSRFNSVSQLKHQPANSHTYAYMSISLKHLTKLLKLT